MRTSVLIPLGAFALTLFPAAASAADASANILAAKIRNQGYKCADAVSATRDKNRSKPGLTAWVLKCSNARYRVEFVPKMAAKVEEMREAPKPSANTDAHQ